MKVGESGGWGGGSSKGGHFFKNALSRGGGEGGGEERKAGETGKGRGYNGSDSKLFLLHTEVTCVSGRAHGFRSTR